MRALLSLMALAGFVSTASANPDQWRREWPETDFTQTTIDDWSEIISGGPPRDGIPALSDPDFIEATEADKLSPREPVITLELDGTRPRAYPVRYLTWHEIVNDTIGGTPVAVTFCPLCNSGITFDRRIEGRTLSFGVSGKLRKSDMIMYDRQTESWWQQALGTAIVGDLTGTELTQLPSWMESWQQYRKRHPNGLVMAKPDWQRAYGTNPYVSYDSATRPFLYDGEMPPHGISPLARVVRVGERAWPLARLREEGGVTEAGVTLDWRSGQASALDTRIIGKGKDVGTVRVRNGAGKDVPHDVLFAFAFHAFFPDGEWMLGD